jgi:hypothetical protein
MNRSEYEQESGKDDYYNKGDTNDKKINDDDKLNLGDLIIGK